MPGPTTFAFGDRIPAAWNGAGLSWGAYSVSACPARCREASHYLAPLVRAVGWRQTTATSLSSAVGRDGPDITCSSILGSSGFYFTAVFFGAWAMVGSENLGGVRDGLLYGLAVFAVGSLPVFMLNMASSLVSAGAIVAWVLQSLCQYALAGLALGWYCGRVGAS